MSEKDFAARCQKWCKCKGYNFSAEKAPGVYAGSCVHLTTLPKNDVTRLLITTAAQKKFLRIYYARVKDCLAAQDSFSIQDQADYSSLLLWAGECTIFSGLLVSSFPDLWGLFSFWDLLFYLQLEELDSLPVVVGHNIAEHKALNLGHRHLPGLNLIEFLVFQRGKEALQPGAVTAAARAAYALDRAVLGQHIPKIRTCKLDAPVTVMNHAVCAVRPADVSLSISLALRSLAILSSAAARSQKEARHGGRRRLRKPDSQNSSATPPASNMEPNLCCRLLYASLIGQLDRFFFKLLILLRISNILSFF
jgi:hypothetical protein